MLISICLTAQAEEKKLPAALSSQPCLNANIVRQMMNACLEKADEIGNDFVIVILDHAGKPLFTYRPPNKPEETLDFAKGKALMSWWLRKPTEDLGEIFNTQTRIDMIYLEKGMHVAGIAGGIPLLYKEQRLGSIGVSGASAEEDKEVAMAGRAVLYAAVGIEASASKERSQ